MAKTEVNVTPFPQGHVNSSIRQQIIVILIIFTFHYINEITLNGSGEQEVVSTLDVLIRHMCAREEINTKKILTRAC